MGERLWSQIDMTRDVQSLNRSGAREGETRADMRTRGLDGVLRRRGRLAGRERPEGGGPEARWPHRLHLRARGIGICTHSVGRTMEDAQIQMRGEPRADQAAPPHSSSNVSNGLSAPRESRRRRHAAWAVTRHARHRKRDAPTANETAQAQDTVELDSKTHPAVRLPAPLGRRLVSGAIGIRVGRRRVLGLGCGLSLSLHIALAERLCQKSVGGRRQLERPGGRAACTESLVVGAVAALDASALLSAGDASALAVAVVLSAAIVAECRGEWSHQRPHCSNRGAILTVLRATCVMHQRTSRSSCRCRRWSAATSCAWTAPSPPPRRQRCYSSTPGRSSPTSSRSRWRSRRSRPSGCSADTRSAGAAGGSVSRGRAKGGRAFRLSAAHGASGWTAGAAAAQTRAPSALGRQGWECGVSPLRGRVAVNVHYSKKNAGQYALRERSRRASRLLFLQKQPLLRAVMAARSPRMSCGTSAPAKSPPDLARGGGDARSAASSATSCSRPAALVMSPGEPSSGAGGVSAAGRGEACWGCWESISPEHARSRGAPCVSPTT